MLKPAPAYLCSLDDLDDPGTREFSVDREGRLQNVFLVRKGNDVFGYLNACPHAGQPLNRMRSRFLNLSETPLFCSAHAATFEIETGLCLGGPCAGKSLTQISLHRDGDEVFLA